MEVEKHFVALPLPCIIVPCIVVNTNRTVRVVRLTWCVAWSKRTDPPKCITYALHVHALCT